MLHSDSFFDEFFDDCVALVFCKVIKNVLNSLCFIFDEIDWVNLNTEILQRFLFPTENVKVNISRITGGF